MNMKMLHLAVVLVLLLLAPILADEVPKTVASVYPSICAGALRDAVLSDLGDGVIAECEDIKVTLKDIEDEIARSPEHMREQVRKYQVHVLEQAVIERLIAKEALDWAKKSGKSTAGEAAVNAYVWSQMQKVDVTDVEALEFYEEHASMFGGVPFEQIKDVIVNVVREEKNSDAQNRFKHSVGKRHSIKVSSSWMEAQSKKWSQNPIEKARLSGKPTLVVFSVIGCCDRMRPVIDVVRDKYADKLNVIFINISEEGILSSIYGVSTIPVEIFYDAGGKEVFRNKRAMSVEDVVEKFKELGVALDTGGGCE